MKLELITPEGPREVRTSVSGWEDFMRSAAWLDMQDAIKLRINELFEEFRIEELRRVVRGETGAAADIASQEQNQIGGKSVL